MAVLSPIVDPDQLSIGGTAADEVTLNFTTRTIALNSGNGVLTDNGVTAQCLYSLLKEYWRTNATAQQYPFPMESITPEQIVFFNGWLPANDATRNLIRTAGWRELNAAGALGREYAGVITLGNIDSTTPSAGDKAYYFFNGQASATTFSFAGSVNQAIQTFGNATVDATTTTFDRRTTQLNVRVRVQGKTFGASDTPGIGVSTLTYQAYRFPLGEETDVKINAALTDLVIDPNSDGNNADSTNPGVAGMTITRYTTPQAKTIGGTAYNFGVVVDGNLATAENIYTYVQWALRQTADIDAGAGSLVGRLADAPLVFVGETLRTLPMTNAQGGGSGVYILDFNANDTNRIEFYDNTGTYRTYPFVAAGSIIPNANAMADAGFVYRMLFTSNPGGNFGSATAVTVNDAGGSPIAGSLGGAASVPFSFAYDGNVQGGRTSGTDAPVTVIGIGFSTAQYVQQTATLTRSTGINISLSPALERNAVNP